MASCAECATGRFAAEAGALACQQCAAGQYQGAVGQSACSVCSAGQPACGRYGSLGAEMKSLFFSCTTTRAPLAFAHPQSCISACMHFERSGRFTPLPLLCRPIRRCWLERLQSLLHGQLRGQQRHWIVPAVRCGPISGWDGAICLPLVQCGSDYRARPPCNCC